jgi:predicted nucleic acid-binding protein
MYMLLDRGNVLCHPFVAGELAMGNLSNRDTVLKDLQELSKPVVGEHEEVLRFVQQHRLFGTGIGYIDAHLLVATQLTPDAWLWTRDKRLLAVAEKLGLAMPADSGRTN